MDVDPSKEFMNASTEWGLHKTFDWLAEQGRVPTLAPSTSPTLSRPPSYSPTGSGNCSGNSGNAGSACSEDAECQCGRRRLLHASERHNEGSFFTSPFDSEKHRGLGKNGNGGGGKPQPPPPSPPVTPLPTPLPTTPSPLPETCGCFFPPPPTKAPTPAPTTAGGGELCSYTSKSTCNAATECFWCDTNGEATNAGNGRCCTGI